MPIAANVIILWPSTSASIPAGWSRETALDSIFPKGAAAAAEPGATGSAASHNHTTQSHIHSANHTHTISDSPTSSGTTARDTGATNPGPHIHTGTSSTANPTGSIVGATPSTDSVNHEPPYFDVIFIKSNGSPDGVPNGAVVLWDEPAATPANWNLCDGVSGRPDMRNKYLKGAAAGGNGGGTGGALTHTHTVASHDHGTNFSHNHPNVTSNTTSASLVAGDVSGANAQTATSAHTHALTIGNQATDAITANTDSAGEANHEPPYWKQAFIQNNAGVASWPDLIIGIWIGTLASIPSSWKLCDGTNSTPDLREKFVKGANTLGEIGNSGGSLTHGHTVTGHAHAVASHNHTVAAGAGAQENRTAGAVNAASGGHTHPSWANTGASSFTSGTGTPIIDNQTNTQPPFYTVAYIQWQASGARKVMKAALVG